jgi:hypothetical protein
VPSEFTKPLIIKDNSDGTFTLVEGFEYHIGSLNTNIVIEVPAGFVTDYASIPRIFQNIISTYGQHGKAAVIHDYLYQMVRENRFNRAIADAIFYEAMGVLGVGFIKRYIMYLAVRCFGWAAVK